MSYTKGWNRLLVTLLAGIIVGALVACGGSGSGGDDDAVNSSGEAASENDSDRLPRAAVGTAAASEDQSPSESESAAGEEALPAGWGGSSLALPALDRKIVQTATLTVRAEEVSARFEDVGNVASSVGGYVSSSTFGRQDEQVSASITIRVPVDSYQEVLRRLRGLGEVIDESSSADDVTEEFTDLDARLRNLRATEAQYLQFLDEARNLEETLLMQDRINGVREQIEVVQGRMQLLEQTSALATITVHLQPPPIVAAAEPPPSEPAKERTPATAASEAFDASVEFLEGVATVIVTVGAFSWWLLVPAIGAGIYFGRRSRRDADPTTGETAG